MLLTRRHFILVRVVCLFLGLSGGEVFCRAHIHRGQLGSPWITHWQFEMLKYVYQGKLDSLMFSQPDCSALVFSAS